MTMTAVPVPTTLVLDALPCPPLDGTALPSIDTDVAFLEPRPRTAVSRAAAGEPVARRSEVSDLWAALESSTDPRVPAPSRFAGLLQTLVGWLRRRWLQLGSWGAGPRGEHLAWGGRRYAPLQPAPRPAPALRHRAPDDDDPVPMRELPSTPTTAPRPRHTGALRTTSLQAPHVLLGRRGLHPLPPRPAPAPALAPVPAPVPAQPRAGVRPLPPLPYARRAT